MAVTSSANPIRWARDVEPAAWWAERARSSGKVADLVPGRYEVCGRVTHPRRRTDGWLPIEERRVLVDVLRGETTTPRQCWFCVEDGQQELDDQGVTERIKLPDAQIRYLLHTAGLLDDVSPSFWWPQDRAWFVATTRKYNLGATYVGGSRQLIDRLIASPDLEVLEAHPDDDLADAARRR
jgi:hypothetical protein